MVSKVLLEVLDRILGRGLNVFFKYRKRSQSEKTLKTQKRSKNVTSNLSKAHETRESL